MPLPRWLLVLALAGALAGTAACGDSGDDPGTLILATTTSTYDSGLLDELVPRFKERTGITVKVIAVGTGAALRMAGEGNADAVLVHAPEAEAPYVASGDLVSGRLVMTNDFVIVGPPDDPAHAASAADLPSALAAIADGGRFVSRGDDSGTHKKELALWATAAIDPSALPREETGQGMGATLTIASERGAYTLTDRATYLSLRHVLDLAVLVEGDASLLNVYHVHVVNPDKHDGIAAAQAEAFAAFLLEPEIQALIGRFRAEELGRSLFTPAAGVPRRRRLMEAIWDGLVEAFRLIGTGDGALYSIAGRTLLVSGSATALAMLAGVPPRLPARARPFSRPHAHPSRASAPAWACRPSWPASSSGSCSCAAAPSAASSSSTRNRP